MCIHICKIYKFWFLWKYVQTYIYVIYTITSTKFGATTTTSMQISKLPEMLRILISRNAFGFRSFFDMKSKPYTYTYTYIYIHIYLHVFMCLSIYLSIYSSIFTNLSLHQESQCWYSNRHRLETVTKTSSDSRILEAKPPSSGRLSCCPI